MSLNNLSRQQKKMLLFLHEIHIVAFSVMANRFGTRPPVNNSNSRSPYTSIYRSLRSLARRGLVSIKQEWTRGPLSVSLTVEGVKIVSRIREDLIVAREEWKDLIMSEQGNMNARTAVIPELASLPRIPSNLTCGRCHRTISFSEARQALGAGERVICWCNEDLTNQAERLLQNSQAGKY